MIYWLCVSHNLFSRILPRTDYKTAYPKEWRIKVLHCYQKPKYFLIYSHPKFQTSFEIIKPFAVESSFFYTKPSSNIKWGCTHHSSFAIFLFFEIESQSTRATLSPATMHTKFTTNNPANIVFSIICWTYPSTKFVNLVAKPPLFKSQLSIWRVTMNELLNLDDAKCGLCSHEEW